MAILSRNEASVLLPPPFAKNDTHKVYSIAVGCVVMCIVTSITVMLRLFARFKAHNFGLDDYASIFALPAYIAWCVMAIYANLEAGVGKPLWEITPAEYSTWFRMFIAAAFLYPIMSTIIRVAVLLFYHRLFAVSTSKFHRATYIFLGLQAAYLIVFLILPGLTCSPLYAAWVLEMYATNCKPIFFVDILTALFSVSLAYDILLTILPLPSILGLQTTRTKKLKIAVLFLLGTGATAAAGYKLGVWVWSKDQGWKGDPIWLEYQFSRFIPPQFSSLGTSFWIPTTVEPSLALISASIPALQPALVKIGRFAGLKLRSITGASNKTSQSTPAHTVESSASRTVKARTPQAIHESGGSDEEQLFGEYIQLGQVSSPCPPTSNQHHP